MTSHLRTLTHVTSILTMSKSIYCKDNYHLLVWADSQQIQYQLSWQQELCGQTPVLWNNEYVHIFCSDLTRSVTYQGDINTCTKNTHPDLGGKWIRVTDPIGVAMPDSVCVSENNLEAIGGLKWRTKLCPKPWATARKLTPWQSITPLLMSLRQW